MVKAKIVLAAIGNFLLSCTVLSACGQSDQKSGPSDRQIAQWNARVDAGIAAVRAGQGAEAESLFKSAYAMNSDTDMGEARKSKLFLWWAKAHAEKKEWENAMGRIRQSTQAFLHSGNTNTAELATIYEAGGDIDQLAGEFVEAEKTYGEALELLDKGSNPEAPEVKVSVLKKLSACYKAENKKADALAAEKKARELEKTLSKA